MTTITTGFLDGNLWEGADPDAYAQAVGERLGELFPDADIDVAHQPGSGSVPLGLQTRAYDDDGNEDEAARYAAEDAISVLDNDICEDGLHPVWRNIAQECDDCGGTSQMTIADVSANTLVPGADDDDWWEAEAVCHNDDCEWVTTRAYRIVAETVES